MNSNGFDRLNGIVTADAPQVVLKADLGAEDFDGLALLMRQKRSLCYSLRTVNVCEERQEEFCDLWVPLLFDTWRHSSVHIPRCDYFLDKYKVRHRRWSNET